MINSIIREVTAVYHTEGKKAEHLYHNTEKLLKLYKKVLWRINSSLKELDEECRETTNMKLVEMIDSMVDIDPRINEQRLNSRLKSIEDSKSILDFIDLSMAQLKDYPDNGERYHDILKRIYIDSTVQSIERLSEIYNISRSTMYREKSKAIEMFGVILWGFLLNEEIE